MLKTGQVFKSKSSPNRLNHCQVVPSIEAGMVGVATHEGRRSYQEDRLS